MKINVEMDMAEFSTYRDYLDDREMYKETLKKIDTEIIRIACSILNAVEPITGKTEQWEIVDQEYMGDAVSAAENLLEMLEEGK